MYLKVVPLRLEVEDIYVIEEEEVISLENVASISPIPGPNNLFKWDSKKDFLCQLSQNVWYHFVCAMVVIVFS